MYGVYVTGPSRKGQNYHEKQEGNWSENYIKSLTKEIQDDGHPMKYDKN